MKRPPRNDSAEADHERTRRSGDVRLTDAPNSAVESVERRQQRTGCRRNRADDADCDPTATQTIGADRQGNGAARGKTNQDPARLGEEGQAKDEHRHRKRGRPNP